jgi:hypothetical protein
MMIPAQTVMELLTLVPDRVFIDIAHPSLPNYRPRRAAAVDACHPADVLAVPTIDSLADSTGGLDTITPRIIDGEIILNIGGVIFDPANDVGRSMFDTYLAVAAFYHSLVPSTRRDLQRDYTRAVGEARAFLKRIGNL